jgi:hypothetical protein
MLLSRTGARPAPPSWRIPHDKRHTPRPAWCCRHRNTQPCRVRDPAAKTGPSGYAGEVEFLHGVASGDPLTDRVILWTRVTPKSGDGAIPVKYEVFGQDDSPRHLRHAERGCRA